MRPGLKRSIFTEIREEVLAEKLSQFIERTGKVKVINNLTTFKEDFKMVEADSSKLVEKDTTTETIVSPTRGHKLSESSSIDRISDDEENTDGKPNHSYISLIANAILSSPDKRLVLSDIYSYVLDNYAYFRNKGPGWRNSIRHNLSLNECFIKAGRSPNGKGHYWAINPANYDDFSKGDFRRRRAQRRARRAMVYGEYPEQYYPHLPYHPYLSMQRHHPYSSYTATLPTTYRSSYYSSPSPTYHSTCYSPPMPKKSEQIVVENIRRKSPKRGFDVESLLRDDDEDMKSPPATEFIKRPSSTEFTPSLPPALYAPSAMYRSTNINNIRKEHILFPEKRSSLASSSSMAFQNNGRFFSDVAPIAAPSSGLLSIDRYRNLYTSNTSKAHHHHSLLQRDLPRISLVQ